MRRAQHGEPLVAVWRSPWWRGSRRASGGAANAASRARGCGGRIAIRR